MRNLLLVGAGGFVGSAARYLVAVALRDVQGVRLPLGTLAVNVLGCLAIGLVAGSPQSRALLDEPTRLLVITGLLGGFTTYSAFAYETYALARHETSAVAIANVALQLVLGIGAVWLGTRLGAAAGR